MIAVRRPTLLSSARLHKYYSFILSTVIALNNLLCQDRHESYIRQLTPTVTPLNRIKVKLLGCSGVGKSTLIESLKCGYFGSLLRKAGLGSGMVYPSSPVKCLQGK